MTDIVVNVSSTTDINLTVVESPNIGVTLADESPIAVVSVAEQGLRGAQGDQGVDGKSAYQVWLDNGNVGTEQDFLDSLVSTVPGPAGTTDYNNLANKPFIPTSLSDLDSDTEHRTVSDAQISTWSNLSGTNLGATLSPTSVVITSDSGSDATIPLATTYNAGVFSPSDKAKLDGIAVGAEVNVNADWNAVSGDAQILNKPSIPTGLSQLSDDTTHRTVTDSEKASWNGKQDALGFTAVPNTRTVAGKALSADITLTKGDVGLSNVDNTSDADKPVSSATQASLNDKEPTFSKNTAFNKNFGTASGTVCEGNDPRLSDARTPTAHTQDISTINGLQAALDGKLDEAGGVIAGDLVIEGGDGGVNVRDSIIHLLGTGVDTGGVVSLPSGTTFTVSGGTGTIVNTTVSPHQYVPVSWVTQTLTNTYVAMSPFTYILIDSSGNIVQQSTEPTIQQYTQNIFLDVIANVGGTQVARSSRQSVTVSAGEQLQEFYRITGAINVKDQIKMSANGANTSLNTSAGTIWRLGANADNSKSHPNSVVQVANTPASCVQYYTNTVGNIVAQDGLVTALNTTQYNNAGTLATIPTNRWQIMRVFMSPNGRLLILLGSTLHTSQNSAVAAINTESYVLPPLLSEQVLLGWLIVKGQTTNLSDTGSNTIINATKTTAGAGGNGGSGDMLAAVYDPAAINQQVLGTTATQIVTNKTISGSNNTISNISPSAITGTAVVEAPVDGKMYVRKDGAWAEDIEGASLTIGLVTALPMAMR